MLHHADIFAEQLARTESLSNNTNSHLAIEPALRENSLRKAMLNSFILGCAAYATYSIPIFVMIAKWPVPLVPIDIIIGGCLSLATSTIVTAVALRLRKS